MIDSQPQCSRTAGFAHRSRAWLVPLMLFASSLLMALAWLGHLKFKSLPFLSALFACWLIVLPEYMLNISAIRLGHGRFKASQMGAFNLCSGVICVALVSRFVLGEHVGVRQLIGFGLMFVAMILIASNRRVGKDESPGTDPARGADGARAVRSDRPEGESSVAVREGPS